MVLQLPPELHKQIYVHLFESTRLAYGKKMTSFTTQKTVKPEPNSLAVLYTCRQIYHEAKGLWIGNVLFSFERVADMLDKLEGLPSEVLSQIRHVRTGGNPLVLRKYWSTTSGRNTSYEVAAAFKLMPSLKLDTLTVLHWSDGSSAFSSLEKLVMDGSGWRELRFIMLDSVLKDYRLQLLSWQPYSHPKPPDLHERIHERDGAGSGASVTIYRPIQFDLPGAVLKAAKRELVQDILHVIETYKDKTAGPWDEVDVTESHNYGDSTVWQNMKDTLFVVKRGHNAEIGVDVNHSILYYDDVRRYAVPGLSWDDMCEVDKDTLNNNREEYVLLEVGDPDPPKVLKMRFYCAGIVPTHQGEETDKYDHRDEYCWDTFG